MAFKSPVGVTEVKVKAAAEVKQTPAVSTPERHYRPLERAREKRRLRLEESQRSLALSAWEKERCLPANRCVQCNHEFTNSDRSQIGSAVICHL